MSDTETLRGFLYRWLIESDLPWGLQAFWKLLTFGIAALCIYAAPAANSTGGTIYLYVCGGASMALGLFTKLGES